MTGMYVNGLDALSKGELDWVGDNWRVALIDGNDYTPNLATDVYHDAIPAAAIVGSTANLAGKAVTHLADGVRWTSNDIVILNVSGDDVSGLVVYKWTGDSATSPLLVFIDAGTGLPYDVNGSDVQLRNPAGWAEFGV